jgi:hypothetical protein
MELNVVKDIIVPILIGLLSSFLFLLLASRVRPHLDISPHIAKMPPEGCVRPQIGYAVKVVNSSRRSATEIRARLALVQKLEVGGGLINQTDDFLLVKNEVFELPGWNAKRTEDSAFRFITYDDIEPNWKGSNYIEFSISAKDSLSGFSRVYSRQYYLKRDVMKDGTFEIGESMRIA